jgi:hypothetical protein
VEISIKCQGAIDLDISELNPFQDDLKDLTNENAEKFKAELIHHGFSEPISVWRNQEKWFVLNGHQRLKTLSLMRAEGWKVPSVPCSIIEASSESEAKEKVLALASQYGEVTNHGLLSYIQNNQINLSYLENIRLPEINLDSFKQVSFIANNNSDKSQSETEVKESLYNNLEHECPKCGFQFNS